MKIDVQGYEIEALKGAKNILAKTKVAILEVSFRSIYENQPLFHDVYEKMYKSGFSFHGNLTEMINPRSGEVVTIDAIFVRKRHTDAFNLP